MRYYVFVAIYLVIFCSKSIAGNILLPSVLTVSAVNSDFKTDFQCDGISDDDEIQAAIDSLPAAGGQINITSGVYYLDDTIRIPSNVTLNFEPGNIVLIPDSHNLDKANNQYIKKGNIVSALFTNNDHINGNEQIQIKGLNIDFGAPTGSTKYAKQQGYAAIWLDKCLRSTVSNCHANNIVYDVDWKYGRAYGILISDSQHCLIDNCEVNGSGYEGIGIRGWCSYCTVRNCYGYGNRNHFAQAAAWSPSITGFWDNIVFDGIFCPTGNLILHGSHSDDYSSKHGTIVNSHCNEIILHGQIDGAKVCNCTIKRLKINAQSFFADEIKNITICGNDISCDPHDGKNSGIKIFTNNNKYTKGNRRARIANINIVGNVVKDGHGLGIFSSTGDQVEINGLTVMGNSFVMECTDKIIYPINIFHRGISNWYNFNISGNRITIPMLDSRSRAIYIGARGTGNIENISITNNQISGPVGICFSYQGNGWIKKIQISNNEFDVMSSKPAVQTSNFVENIAVRNNIVMGSNIVSTHDGIKETDEGNLIWNK